MRFFLLLSFLVLANSNQVLSESGHGEGNGGGAIVCREGNLPNGNILKAIQLDVWEAEEYGIRDNLEIDINLAYKKIETNIRAEIPEVFPSMHNYFNAIKEQIESSLLSERNEISTDNMLNDVGDAGINVFPRDCAKYGYPNVTPRYELVVNYQDDRTILIDTSLFNSFSQMSKLGIYVHEVIYALLRDYRKDEFSTDARKITGVLIAYAANLLSREEANTVLFEILNQTVGKPGHQAFSLKDIELRLFTFSLKYWKWMDSSDFDDEKISEFANDQARSYNYLGLTLNGLNYKFNDALMFILGDPSYRLVTTEKLLPESMLPQIKKVISTTILANEYRQCDQLFTWTNKKDIDIAKRLLGILLRNSTFDFSSFAVIKYMGTTNHCLDGVTPLMIAANLGDVDLVKWLLTNKKFTNRNKKSSMNKTASEYAMSAPIDELTKKRLLKILAE